MIKNLCTVIMILSFVFFVDCRTYAEETTKKEESFSEYTERIMREKAEAAGMTYEEYMQLQRDNQKETSVVIDEVENKKDKEYDLDMVDLLWSLVLTALLYLIIPIVIRIGHKSAFDGQMAFKIALINSIVIGLISAIVTINVGKKWTVYACVLYFFINKFILSCTRKKKNKL